MTFAYFPLPFHYGDLIPMQHQVLKVAMLVWVIHADLSSNNLLGGGSCLSLPQLLPGLDQALGLLGSSLERSSSSSQGRSQEARGEA